MEIFVLKNPEEIIQKIVVSLFHYFFRFSELLKLENVHFHNIFWK